jgi:hypothetical protein
VEIPNREVCTLVKKLFRDALTNLFVLLYKASVMDQDELARLFGQQVFNELAEEAIEDMRATGKSFD